MATHRQSGESSKSSSSKKKKSSGDADQPKNQTKISDFFSPSCPLSWSAVASENRSVPLNDEQIKVLDMVVNRGKNIFFTGAAGVWGVRRPQHY